MVYLIYNRTINFVIFISNWKKLKLHKIFNWIDALTDATVLDASQVTVFKCISLLSFKFKFESLPSL